MSVICGNTGNRQEIECLNCDCNLSQSTPRYSASGFNYVDVVGKGCDGWLNLFFGNSCIALVNDVGLADQIRQAIPKRNR